MGPTKISIEKLRDHTAETSLCYRSHLIVNNQVPDISSLRNPARIDALSLLVCTRGEIDLSVNLNSYRITSNMIVVNLPDNIISVEASRDTEAFVVFMSSDFLNELDIDFSQRSDFYIKMRRTPVYCVSPEALSVLQPYFRLLEYQIKNSSPESHQIIRSLSRAFAYTVISMVRLCDPYSPGNFDMPDDGARGKVVFNKFMALIKDHHARQRGVRFYADSLCLSPNYLSAVIRKYTGRTAKDWINDYVMLEAKLMLKDSELSIQEISYRLNFPTQSSFGKYFKLFAGCSPKNYRRRLR